MRGVWLALCCPLLDIKSQLRQEKSRVQSLFSLSYMCVQVHVCTCVLMHVKSEQTLQCHFSNASCPFVRSRVSLGPALCQAGLVLLESTCLHLHLYLPDSGITRLCGHTWIFAQGLNSSPRPCAASSPYTELFSPT